MPLWGVVAGIAAVGSVLSGNKARKANKSAARAEQQITKIQNYQARREFRQSFRDALAQSAVSNIAALGGGYESSRGASQAVSLRTQKNIGEIEMDKMEALGDRAVSKRLDASRYGFASNVFSQVTSFSMSPTGKDLFDKLEGK